MTYTVIVEAPNLDRKLLPGMTANLTFQIEKHAGMLKVPNGALRFFPKANQIRPCDVPILEGTSPDNKENRDADSADDAPKDDDPAAKDRSRKERYVWIVEGDLLKAVKITTGLSDKSSTEIVSGDLSPGQAVVTGMQTH